MRVISWNMAAASPQIANSRHEEAWQYLLSQNPDIAILQEVRVPTWAANQYNVIWAKAYDRQSWGSAVVSKMPVLGQFDVAALEPQLENLIRGLKGQNIGATLELPSGTPLVAISIHTPAVTVPKEKIPGEILAEIKLKLNPKVWYADILYGALKQLSQINGRFIFGGDWNTSRQFDELYGPRGNQEFFDRMETAGFVECFRRFHDKEVRTWFKKGQAPFQLDHLFCDPKTAESLRSCSVDPVPALDGLSDHAPLIIEFDGI